jgi:hypothetical protein
LTQTAAGATLGEADKRSNRLGSKGSSSNE